MASTAALKINAPSEQMDAPSPRPNVVQPAASPPPPAPVEPAPAKASPVRRIILGVALLAALGTAVWYGYDYVMVGRFQISTDDAYVKADSAVLGAKIPGYVQAVPVDDNASVKAGDVVLKLDSGDYDLAVAAAQAKIETQKAQIATIAQQKIAQNAQVSATLAQLASAKAAELNAVQTQNRASTLVKTNVGSQQALDDATKQRASAEAAVNVADANIAAAQAQLGILDAQAVSATRSLDELTIALQKAQRDQSFTDVKAPFDGVVANRAVQQGQYVGAGTRLLALVPTQLSFITANFKETQISDIHPGQKATITVDAFKSEKYEGKVVSLAPASGAEFSLLPPDNATGNFTKITQRLPVKISVPPELAAKLRPGLSATVSVDLRDSGTK